MATPPNPLALLGMDVPPEALMAARAAALRKQVAQRPAMPEEAEALGAIGPGAALSPSVALAEALRNRTPDTGAYELFSGDNEGAVRTRAEGVNLGLGRQRAAGNLGLLTGDRVLSGFGQAQLQGADRQEGMLAEAGQFRAGQTLKKALEAEEAKRQARIDTERERHNRTMEGRPPSNVFLQGPGGQYFMGSTRGNAPLVPVENPTTGDPLHSPKADDLAAAEAKRAEEKAAKERAHEEKVGQLKVGGFDFADPNALPTIDGAKKMAEVSTARDAIVGSLSNLETLFKQHGTEVAGPVAEVMGSEWKNITDHVRIIGDMGVPNGNDYVMLALQIPQTVGLKAGLTPNSFIQPKFETLRSQIERLVGATAKAYKYKPETITPRVGTRDNPAPSNPTPDIDLEAPPTAETPAPAKESETVTLHWTTGGTTQTPAARAKKLAAEQPEKYSLTPFPPEKVRRKQYSKKANVTRVTDGNGKQIAIEEGDTRGR